MVISIAIADKNFEYINRMSDLLQKYNDLSVSLFTSGEKLSAAIESSRFDIVLFDPDISDTKLEFHNVKLPICLYSDESNNTGLYSDLNKIHKYQRISNIYKEFIKLYAEKAGTVMESGGPNNTKITAVYSPVGGSGKTTIALAIAASLAERDKKVLFVSFEQLASSASIYPYKEEGITSLLAAISGDTVFGLKLKGVAKTGAFNVDYIEGFERIVDYRAVNMEETGELLTKIKNSGLYDNVVVDTNSNIDDILTAVFEQANNIVIVNKPGTLSSFKIEMFSKQSIADDYRPKMAEVRNK